MFCTKCGTEIKDGFKFCPKCGTPVSVEKEKAESENKTRVSEGNSIVSDSERTTPRYLASKIILR